MLHGHLALVVISADAADEKLRALVDGLAQNQLVDSIYVSLPSGAAAELPPATVIERDGGAEMLPVLESIFEVPSAERLIDPSFPPIIVFASASLGLEEIEGAMSLYSASRRAVLVGVTECDESPHILLPDDTIRAAFPRLVSEEPVRHVTRDPRLAIGDYQDLKGFDESSLVAELGWVTR